MKGAARVLGTMFATLAVFVLCMGGFVLCIWQDFSAFTFGGGLASEAIAYWLALNWIWSD